MTYKTCYFFNDHCDANLRYIENEYIKSSNISKTRGMVYNIGKCERGYRTDWCCA